MCRKSCKSIVDTSLEKVLVVIPVRNEEKTIAAVIQDLQSFGLTKIRVVDNNSSDRSAEVAKGAGAEVLFEPQSGYGRTCWRGIQNVPSQIDWILFVDGDGSDDLSYLPQFFVLTEKYDFILGDRRATPEGKAVMTPVQHFGNGLAGWLINFGWGHRYHDLGPLRLIRRSALEQLSMQDRGFGWTVEMQVKAIEAELNICEIPVGYRPRQGGKSKISGTVSGSIQAGTIILTTIGRLYLSRNKKEWKDKIWLWLSVFCLLLGAVATAPYGDFRQPETVINFGYGIAVMCLGFVCSWRLKYVGPWWFWSCAIATRLILLPMYPGDDIWRYIWEGSIQLQGFSPYDFAPNAAELTPYRTEWWSQINHPAVSAIYPPLTQLGFRNLAAISPSVILFKISFAIADLLTCWLLTQRFSYVQTILYAWNPLVIYSFAGGGHYDSWFILPLVAGWLCWSKQEQNLVEEKTTKNASHNSRSVNWDLFSALAIGISIAVKWISLPVLGFLSWNRSNSKFKAILIFACGILPLCLSSALFCHENACQLIPTGSTFVSHGRSAEFIPHLLAKVWHFSTQTNSIYALPLGIVTLFLIFKLRDLQQFIFGFFASLLIISPIIHGWYFTWIIPFAVGTKNWGVRLVSLSAFTYFVLPYRQALGDRSWNLTEIETWLLWLPFIVGLGWSFSKRRLSSK